LYVYQRVSHSKASSEDFVVENALPKTTWHSWREFFLRKDPNSWMDDFMENP